MPRPQPFPELKDASGGRCQCGALFIADVTGKLGGEALMHALTLIAGGDTEQALGLTSGVDYELVKLGYRPRTHSLDKWMPGRGAFGRPKLWFIRDLRG